MKPIFIAGATLLAASSAFGFAKAVDYLASAPEIVAPQLGNTTERRMPTASRESAAALSTNTFSASAFPQSDIADGKPAEQAAMVEKTQKIAATSYDETPTVPRANYLMPFTNPDDILTTPDTYSNMGSPDITAQNQFHNLPMIGVYR